MPGRRDGAPYKGSKRFHWNVINVGIIAAVVVAGFATGTLLLTQKERAAGGNTPDTAQSPQAASANMTGKPAAATDAAGGGTASPAASPEQTPAPTPGEDSGYFTEGGVQVNGMTYRSADLYVNVKNVNEDGVNYYVADCRMRDANKLFTALANDKYALHKGEKTSVMAKRKGAVIAINGDYYGYRPDGIVLRNGTLYREAPYFDVAAVYGDGTMKTYAKDEKTADELKAEGALHVFSFGPMLLDGEGKAFLEADMKKREPKVNPRNPRSGIGYIEPNHFVLVVVDGRDAGGSRGMTQAEFSKLFESLGCKSAYNFNGGGTATMVFMGKVINHPCDEGGERSVSDIVYFGESLVDRANIERMNK